MSDKVYWYGMRLRPYGIGCQPKGVWAWSDDETGKYWNKIAYKNPLDDKDIVAYDLDYLGEEEAVR